MRKYLFILFFFLTSIAAMAQRHVTGLVVESDTEEPVAHRHVYPTGDVRGI